MPLHEPQAGGEEGRTHDAEELVRVRVRGRVGLKSCAHTVAGWMRGFCMLGEEGCMLGEQGVALGSQGAGRYLVLQVLDARPVVLDLVRVRVRVKVKVGARVRG